MTKKIFHLQGLTCSACKKITEKRINSIPGVIDANVDLNTGKVEVKSTQSISLLDIESALDGTQYQVSN